MDILEALELAACELVARSYEIATDPLNWGPDAEPIPEAESKSSQLRLVAQTLREYANSLVDQRDLQNRLRRHGT